MIRVMNIYERYEFIVEVIVVRFKGNGLRYEIFFVRAVDLWRESVW